MRIKRFITTLLLFFATQYTLVAQTSTKEIDLKEISLLIENNKQIIIATLNQRISQENVDQSKSTLLPELNINGDSYLSHTQPLNKGKIDNLFMNSANIAAEADIYSGGRHSNAIKMKQKEQQISDDEYQAIKDKIQLESYILLYDIYRNIKYIDFICSSIYLREKEYERIEQLFDNGLVLKSDLLRSKLDISDLQKDKVAIENNISILSERLCLLLGFEERFNIIPLLDNDLNYSLSLQFDDLFTIAQTNSPALHIQSLKKEYEEISLKSINSLLIPNLKLFASYGFNPTIETHAVTHQLSGVIGARLSIPISSFYKNRHMQAAQKQRITKSLEELNNKNDELRELLYSTYIRYNESLENIKIAKEKIEMAKESARILRNSYFNQQALLIDVLESETQSMEASFEWIEAVVDSQKYYWSIKQISGNML